VEEKGKEKQSSSPGVIRRDSTGKQIQKRGGTGKLSISRLVRKKRKCLHAGGIRGGEKIGITKRLGLIWYRLNRGDSW